MRGQVRMLTANVFKNRNCDRVEIGQQCRSYTAATGASEFTAKLC